MVQIDIHKLACRMTMLRARARRHQGGMPHYFVDTGVSSTAWSFPTDVKGPGAFAVPMICPASLMSLADVTTHP